MEPQPALPPRGRPRAFDAEAALRAALRVFRDRGYQGASMAELTDAMGIMRPSLYATFGNKESLFRKALDLYGREQGSFLADALEASTAREVMQRFLRGSLETQTSDSGPRGCLSVTHAVACGPDATMVRDAVLARIADVLVALRKRFDRAAAEGDLPDDISADALARHVVAVSHGMALQAGAGVSRADLELVIAVTMRLLP